jgi:hypothetical protein
VPGAPATAPAVAPGGVPSSSPASQGTSAPAAPAGEPVSPPPADSGATGAPAGAPGPVPGSGGGAEGGPGGGQGVAPADGPRSLLPGTLLPTPVPGGLWARLARWLQPEAAASPAPVEPPDVLRADPAVDTAEQNGGRPEPVPSGVAAAQEGGSNQDRAPTAG